jgi:hypothetical protein
MVHTAGMTLSTTGRLVSALVVTLITAAGCSSGPSKSTAAAPASSAASPVPSPSPSPEDKDAARACALITVALAQPTLDPDRVAEAGQAAVAAKDWRISMGAGTLEGYADLVRHARGASDEAKMVAGMTAAARDLKASCNKAGYY